MIGRVYLCRKKKGGHYYALKCMRKTDIFKRKCITLVRSEVELLFETRHIFIIKLFGVFQDDYNVYLLFEYAPGGELFSLMNEHKISENAVKFYAAEISVALNYLHCKIGVMFRDLKPENILLDCAGHVKLIDFGFAKRINLFRVALDKPCGTSQYLAPEMIPQHSGRAVLHGVAVDWWALGCLIYEMLCGEPPFGDTREVTKYEVFMRAKAAEFKFPSTVSTDARKVVTGLLTVDPAERYGLKELQKSEWLSDVDWVAIEKGKITPPYHPPVDAEQEGYRENFRAHWAEEDVVPSRSVVLSAAELAYCNVFGKG